MLAYTQDQYHVSLTLSQQDNDWTSHQYYATTDAGSVDADTNATAWAARATGGHRNGHSCSEISVGYDISILMDRPVLTKFKKLQVTL